MNRIATGAGVIGGAAVALLVLATRDEPAAPMAPPPPARHAAAAAPRPAPPVAAATQPAPPRDIVLHGVLMGGAQSQAVLSVAGQPQAPYAIGDRVEGGWSVQAIGEQQVVLANGGTQAVVPVATGRTTAATPAVRADAAASAAPRLPGFVAGAPAPFTDAGASERNRRFLDAVHARRGTGS